MVMRQLSEVAAWQLIARWMEGAAQKKKIHRGFFLSGLCRSINVLSSRGRISTSCSINMRDRLQDTFDPQRLKGWYWGDPYTLPPEFSYPPRVIAAQLLAELARDERRPILP